tara:strand:- start:239 stop:1531 length:1293 start_codon:yes stop_codon:yes gene_type:complete
MKYKEYPKYKDSGVEWIGDIPEGWEINKIKFYFEIKSGKTLQSSKKNEDDIQVPYITAGNVFWDKIEIDDLSMMNASSEEIKMYQIQNGDLLVSEGGDSGRSAIVDKINFDCIIQNHVHRLRPLNGSSSGYLENVLRSIKESGWFDALTKRVTMNNLPSLILANIIMPVPSEKEQYEIYNFLQKKKIQFDELIAKSKAQVTLLEEKRQATIIQAVTKGLDPSVKMKDSGVEWIGKIPEGWEVVRLKHNHAQVIAGQSPSSSSYVDDGRGIQFLQGCETFGDLHPHPKIRTIEPTKIVQQNTVLISVRAPVGTLNIANSEICIGRGLAGIVAKENNLSYKFLYYFLNLSSKIISGGSRGTTFQSIRTEELENSLIVSMPYEEQEQISEFLDKQTTQFDELIAKSKAQITLLEEKRQALITATVTGKIDVRS